MKAKHVAIGAAVLATTAFCLTHLHVGPSQLYPNSTLTPGVIATQSIAALTQSYDGQTYSAAHRKTSDSMKTQVRNEYPNCPKDAEIDHLVPLAIGGADDVRNLWCQPAQNMWKGQNFGFHQKDALETFLANQVKAKRITPSDAQQCIVQDWVACYQHYIQGDRTAGQDPDVVQ